MKFNVILLLAALALLGGCASAPKNDVVGIAAQQDLLSLRSDRTQRVDQYLDGPRVARARSVLLPEVMVAPGALDVGVTETQGALVANRAARELCSNLSKYFSVRKRTADLHLQIVVTQIRATSAGASGASALIGIAVPGPFRLPAGLGGLAAEASASSADGTQRLLTRWSKGANPVLDDARISSIGDAYQLADTFADAFARTLIKPTEALKKKPRVRLAPALITRNQKLCDARFGRASLAGRGASFILPLAPEAIDAGAPEAPAAVKPRDDGKK